MSGAAPSGRLIARDTGTILVVRVAAMVGTLLTTAAAFRCLSTSEFGLYAIVGAIVQFAAIGDLGIGTALVRVATQDGPTALARHVSAGLIALGALTLALTLAVGAFALLFSGWADAEGAASMIWVVPLSVLGVGISTTAGALSAVGYAVGRGHHAAILVGLSQTAYSVLAVGLLVAGLGLAAIPIGLLISGLGSLVIGFLFLRSLYDEPVLATPAASDVRDVLKFGGWIQVSSFSDAIAYGSDKIVLGAVSGPSAVAPVELATRVTQVSRMVPSAVLAASFAPIARSEGSRSKDRSASVHRLAGSASLVIAAASGALALVAAPAMLLLISGEPQRFAVTIASVLTVAQVAASSTGGATLILRAHGQPRLEGVTSVVSLITNLAISIPLTMWFGTSGLIAGTAVSTVVGVVMFWLLCPVDHATLRELARPCVFSGTVLLAAVLLAASTTLMGGTLAAQLGLTLAALLATLVLVLLAGLAIRPLPREAASHVRGSCLSILVAWFTTAGLQE